MATTQDSLYAAPAAATSNAAARQRRSVPVTATLYVTLTFLSLMYLFPFVWLFAASLKPSREIFDGSFFPSDPTLANYRHVFTSSPVFHWLANTMLIAVAASLLVILSSIVVAYGFARLRFRGRGVLFSILLASYMLPGAVTLIPTFLIWNELGLVGTFYPLFLGNIFASSFYVFMLRQFFLGLPQDLIDAARLDGAGYFRILVGILVPLLKPVIIAIGVFEMQAKWDDFLLPLIYLNRRTDFTLSVGLGTLKGEAGTTDWGLLMAASVLMTIPMIALFFSAQKLFIQGLSATTGLKG